MADDYGSFISNNDSEVNSVQMQQNQNPNRRGLNEDDLNSFSRNSSDTESIASIGSIIKTPETLRLSENLSNHQKSNSPTKLRGLAPILKEQL